MRGADSTRGRAGRQQTSSGAIDRNSNGGRRLTHDQITQLQTALQQANCDPGTIDGVMGQRTRSAMICARERNNITGNNNNDLYRALNLNFTNSDSLNGAANMRTRSSRGDSMRRPGTRKDSTRGPGG
jgi:peptidoglycan hydrolase-like protein with peptidoglycan-binding domain